MNSALIIIDMQMFMQERIDSGRDHVNPQYRCQNLPLNIEAALASNTRQNADADLGSLYSERPGNLQADTGRRAGDERSLVVEIQIHGLVPFGLSPSRTKLPPAS